MSFTSLRGVTTSSHSHPVPPESPPKARTSEKGRTSSRGPPSVVVTDGPNCVSDVPCYDVRTEPHKHLRGKEISRPPMHWNSFNGLKHFFLEDSYEGTSDSTPGVPVAPTLLGRPRAL